MEARAQARIEVREVLDTLDAAGRWIDRDIKVASGIPRGDYILAGTFVDNASTLITYLRMTRP